MAFRPSKYFLDMIEKERQKKRPKLADCDVPSCKNPGEYRAPKTRALDEYYNFCLEHVQEYNKNWDFFDGMSRAEIENHMYNTFLWDRPTTEMAGGPVDFERLQRRIYENLEFGEHINFQTGQKNSYQGDTEMPAQERDALAVLGVEPPLEWDEVQSAYKKLVKKYHPDIHDGSDPEAEEKMKRINMAYSVLKIAYQKYKVLEGT